MLELIATYPNRERLLSEYPFLEPEDMIFIHTWRSARQSGPSVLFLQPQGLDARGQAELVQTVFDQCADVLRDGAPVSAARDRIRIRRLPLR